MREAHDDFRDDSQNEANSLTKLSKSVKGFNDIEKVILELLEGEVMVNVNLNEKLIYKILFDQLNIFVGIGKNVIVEEEKLNYPISDIEFELNYPISDIEFELHKQI